ncbi:16200_t:CDS:2, partial [Acaulospora colombiana]
MSKAKIDLANLDFSRTYSFEEFELINKQLKTRSLEVKGQPVNLFDLDKNGKLVPIPQATACMEATVSTIGRPFTPTFVVEVGDTESRSTFEELDGKFKREYFAVGTSVQL